MHQLLQVGPGENVLDVACGSGLAVELAAARGAVVAGLDASPRLVAVAPDRSPQVDLRVGDMHDLPWAHGTFDVVTSFRGIWGTTPGAVAEVRRTQARWANGLDRVGSYQGLTGGVGLGAIHAGSAGQGLQPRSDGQARPAGSGRGTALRLGLRERPALRDSVAWEFADPDHYARALAATGPAYEAILAVGEAAFLDHARALAEARVRDGLPLRAMILLVGYIATKPQDAAPRHDHEPSGSFSAASPQSVAAERLRTEDLEDLGYVMNASQLWGRMPATLDGLRPARPVRQGRPPRHANSRDPRHGDCIDTRRLGLFAGLGRQTGQGKRRRNRRLRATG